MVIIIDVHYGINIVNIVPNSKSYKMRQNSQHVRNTVHNIIKFFTH